MNWTWQEWVNLIQMTIIPTTLGKNPLEESLIVNQRDWNVVLGCNLKNDRMILVHFQGKPFNITVIQVYSPNTDGKQAEAFFQSYEDLQHLLAATAAAKSLQSCLTLCNPIHGSPPGSPVPGILQARTLEWVSISFSNAWKWKWSHSVVSAS